MHFSDNYFSYDFDDNEVIADLTNATFLSRLLDEVPEDYKPDETVFGPPIGEEIL